MKFMSSFQCLMGGNVVQLQESASSVSPTAIVQSSLHNQEKMNGNVMKKNKKTKTKKKKFKKVITVFKPDGDISVYHKPMMVAEVMTTDEYMVCRSDSFYIGQKIQSLSGNDRLQPGHSYFLLPAHLLHTVLSFVTVASFTTSKKTQEVADGVNAKTEIKAAFLKKAAASSCSPFNIQKTPSGTLRIQVSEMFISQLMMEQTAASNHGCGSEDVESSGPGQILCTTPQLHREYKQLVAGARRCWKPKLEMIKESPLKGKRKVKMLLSASFNSMKKKMRKKNNNPQVSSSSSASSKKKKVMKKKVKTKKNTRAAAAAVALPPSSALIKAKKVSTTT